MTIHFASEVNNMTIQILHRYSGTVLFEHDGANLRGANLSEANLSEANLSEANLSGADLSGANLREANLRGANLRSADLGPVDLHGANLSGANLSGAYLSGADLSGADLSGANLIGANLREANLSGACLSGAYLSGADLGGAKLKNGEKLIGERPIFQVGPIGSRNDFLITYITDQGLRLDAGCQRQITREVFEARLAKFHGMNKHGKEYSAVLALIDVHAKLWTHTDLTAMGDHHGLDLRNKK